MTPLLNDLITGAIQLAGDAGVAHAARLWQSEGGPGYADCLRNCRHGMQTCPQDDDIDDQLSGD